MKQQSRLTQALLAGSVLAVLSVQCSQPSRQKILKQMNAITAQNEGDMKQLRLTDCNYKGKIRSEKEKTMIVNSMYADNAPISYITNIEKTTPH